MFGEKKSCRSVDPRATPVATQWTELGASHITLKPQESNSEVIASASGNELDDVVVVHFINRPTGLAR